MPQRVEDHSIECLNLTVTLRVTHGGENVLHAKDETNVLEELRGEFFSVFGEKRNRWAIHEHPLVHDRDNFRMWMRPQLLRVPVCDDKEKPIPAGNLD